MMIKNKIRFYLLVLIALLPACGGGGGTSFSPSVGIFIDPPTADVVIAQTLQLKASPQNTSSGVIWSVDGGSSFGSIDANGLYTAPAIVPSTGMAVVRAKLMSDNQIQETVEITVLEPTP